MLEFANCERNRSNQTVLTTVGGDQYIKEQIHSSSSYHHHDMKVTRKGSGEVCMYMKEHALFCWLLLLETTYLGRYRSCPHGHLHVDSR